MCKWQTVRINAGVSNERTTNHKPQTTNGFSRMSARCHAGLATFYTYRKKDRIPEQPAEGRLSYPRFWQLCIAQSHSSNGRYRCCAERIELEYQYKIAGHCCQCARSRRSRRL